MVRAPLTPASWLRPGYQDRLDACQDPLNYLVVFVCSIKLFIMLRKLLKLYFRVLDLAVSIAQLYLDPLTLWSQSSNTRIKRTRVTRCRRGLKILQASPEPRLLSCFARLTKGLQS